MYYLLFYYLPLVHWMVDPYIYPCLCVHPCICLLPTFSPRCHRWIFWILHACLRSQSGLLQAILYLLWGHLAAMYLKFRWFICARTAPWWTPLLLWYLIVATFPGDWIPIPAVEFQGYYLITSYCYIVEPSCTVIIHNYTSCDSNFTLMIYVIAAWAYVMHYDNLCIVDLLYVKY